MTYAKLGHLLAHYLIKRGLVGKQELYKEFIWTDIRGLLEEFVENMQNEDLDTLAANCLNHGYTYPPWGPRPIVAKMGDRIMCRLMSRALFFMNEWPTPSARTDHTDPQNEELKEHIRCAIVNVFMNILNESTCRSRMGIHYAWEVVKELHKGLPALIINSKCQQGEFENIQIGEFDMAEKIKEWLKKNPSLTDKIGGMGIDSTCRKSVAQLDGARQDANDMDAKIQLQQEEKEAVRELGQAVKTIVEEVKTEVERCAQETAACIESIDAVTRSNPQEDDSEAIVSNSVAGGTTATEPTEKDTQDTDTNKPGTRQELAGTGAAKSGTTKPQAPASPVLPQAPSGSGRNDSTAGPDGQPQAPASPVLPARPPSPPQPKTENDQASPGQGAPGDDVPQPPPAAPPRQQHPAAGEKKKEPVEDTDVKGKDTNTMEDQWDFLDNIDPLPGEERPDPRITDETDKYSTGGPWGLPGAARTISISKGTSVTTLNVPTGKEKSDSIPAPEPEPPAASREQKPGEPTSAGKLPSQTPLPEPPSSADAPATESAGTGAGESGSKADKADHPTGWVHVGGSSQKDNTSDSFWGSAKDDIGWDTYFPWDKPGTTKTQKPVGSLRPVLSSYDKSSFGCNDADGLSGHTSCDLRLPPASPPEGINAGGGFVPPAPEDGPRSQNDDPGGVHGGPFFPDLTDTVLTATTPILVFVTSVIFALLSYSLWKYFAYLGKQRRRKFRTVRDVPSPPLDEEILQHLQRGDLPPPDYGYTMVRDRRPASTSGRGRPPRVHKRTLIELHLEVLHECEAAEWANVKEHYWQIVVEEFAQEFAQDLMRDKDTNNNILGVPTSKQGLSGNHVSFTMDPPSDSDGIHPCPRNDDNPDPWTCMETIPLATDPSASNEEDRWSCMETIQLATHPSASNHDDPDPWSWKEKSDSIPAPEPEPPAASREQKPGEPTSAGKLPSQTPLPEPPSSADAPATESAGTGAGESGSKADKADHPTGWVHVGGSSQKDNTSDSFWGSAKDDIGWDTYFPWDKPGTTKTQKPVGSLRPVLSSYDKSSFGCNDADGLSGHTSCDLRLPPASPPEGINAGGGFVPPAPEDGPRSQNDDPGGVHGGPFFPDLTDTVLTATTPILVFVTSVIFALLSYSLWKYFAYLGKQRRRKFRTVRDVPSPPLDEEILQHLQRGDLPPPDYGYTMVRDRRPASTSGRGRPPRVHKRTLIELHLEVLHECEAAEWANVKEHYWQIVVEEFAQEFAQDLMRDKDTNNNILGVPTSKQGLSGNHVSFTMDPPSDSDGIHPCPRNDDNPDPWTCMETIPLATDPSASNEEDRWSCMETIQLATHPSASNHDDPDPWSCMETIQLDTQRDPYSSPRNECPLRDHTNWINWIERHKHLLRACTMQPWFLQLKADWKQYLRERMAATGASGDHRKAATMESTKLRLWKEWVAQQHRQMRMYKEQWCKHLLHNVEEETVPEKGEEHILEKDLEVETVMAAEDMLTVTAVPRPQLHPQPYMKKRLIAKLWMLLLASVIEECEFESSMQEKELYLDDLLQQCSH
ncbi:hypothetical protein AK88_00169 [Plasmodium fragile]|uniref:Schizont-infected cell agglutination C-terminal domain-containing protein n=1 Tax=Plasmodium fragile TaxID=5857 RepID=A0A0D9QSD0_PLAFR|nr:uncharacterized protein AK88_00169 [Plasmodium fragile]KJP90000.1 hypothetical protein AK88_00169 [Plasmodium fragile]